MSQGTGLILVVLHFGDGCAQCTYSVPSTGEAYDNTEVPTQRYLLFVVFKIWLALASSLQLSAPRIIEAVSDLTWFTCVGLLARLT